MHYNYGERQKKNFIIEKDEDKRFRATLVTKNGRMDNQMNVIQVNGVYASLYKTIQMDKSEFLLYRRR